MTYFWIAYAYENVEELRRKTRRSNISRIRAHGRLRQRVRLLEARLEELTHGLAALASVVEEKGVVTRAELVAALGRLRPPGEDTET